MSAFLKEHAFDEAVLNSIMFHPAWLGHISGLKAEKMLRGRNKPYLYVLRAGEHEMEYYATFVDHDLTISHRPFVITIGPEGWYHENGGGGGPYKEKTINDIIHLIMHCEKNECTPLINFQTN